MSLSGTTPYGQNARMIFRGFALMLERSGRADSRDFYIWATDDENARKIASRTFPKATKIIIRKRTGDDA